MADYRDEIDELLASLDTDPEFAAPPVAAKPEPLMTTEEEAAFLGLPLPEKFGQATEYAVRDQLRILNLPLDETSPHFKAVLSAKVQIVNAQISNQLRADENRLRVLTLGDEHYERVKTALDEFRRRRLASS